MVLITKPVFMIMSEKCMTARTVSHFAMPTEKKDLVIMILLVQNFVI